MSAAGAMALTGAFVMLAAALLYIADEESAAPVLAVASFLCLIAAPWIAVLS